jgi:hypothetical protein
MDPLSALRPLMPRLAPPYFFAIFDLDAPALDTYAAEANVLNDFCYRSFRFRDLESRATNAVRRAPRTSGILCQEPSDRRGMRQRPHECVDSLCWPGCRQILPPHYLKVFGHLRMNDSRRPCRARRRICGRAWTLPGRRIATHDPARKSELLGLRVCNRQIPSLRILIQTNPLFGPHIVRLIHEMKTMLCFE